MKSHITLAALLACALPALAQPAAKNNGLPFRIVSPAEAEKLAITAPIKLDLDNVTLAAALDELQKQGGTQLNLSRGSKETLAKTLSIHLETRSFNRAFAEIIAAAGVKASLQGPDYRGQWSIGFEQADDGTGALQSETGLFRARLMSLNSTLSKTTNLDDSGAGKRVESNNLTVNLTLLPDLRLPLIGVPRTRVTRADDDRNRSLAPKPDPDADRNNYRNNAYSFYNDGYRQQQNSLRLLAPAPDAKTLAHLEGVVIYALVTQTELWEVPDLLSQPQWKHTFRDGEQKFEMTLKPTLKDGKDLRMNIEVTTDQTMIDGQVSPPMLASGPVLANMRIVDANGTVFRSDGGGGYGQKLTISTGFYPALAGSEDKPTPLTPPLKLVFNAPVQVVQTEVPFSFEDVPLP